MMGKPETDPKFGDKRLRRGRLTATPSHARSTSSDGAFPPELIKEGVISLAKAFVVALSTSYKSQTVPSGCPFLGSPEVVT
jgi:hypothetical protein